MEAIKVKHESSGRRYPRPTEQCPDCRGIVVLCWGKKLKPHWRHKVNNSGCHNAGESLNHKYAKQLLSEFLSSGGKIEYRQDCKNCKNQESITISLKEGHRVQLEHPHNGIVFDLVCLGDDNISFAIEVCHTHITDNIKQRSAITWMEVQADEVIKLLDLATRPSKITLSNLRTDFVHPRCVKRCDSLGGCLIDPTLDCSIGCQPARCQNHEYCHGEGPAAGVYRHLDFCRSCTKGDASGYSHKKRIELAKKMGCLIEHEYNCEASKAIEIVRRGLYATHCWIKKSKKTIEDGDREHLRRMQHCIQCGRSNLSTYCELYCEKCREEFDENDTSYVYNSVSKQYQREMQKYFLWLDGIEGGGSHDTLCSLCQRDYNDPALFEVYKNYRKDDDLAVSSTTYWAGQYKKCCTVCLQERYRLEREKSTRTKKL